ncbi:MAG: hypothetical protein KAS07_05505, partial [Candidatus Pacebacteria bacterium]|nr:hypothetical protein [Candidatus Paceibacterota bacterium]
LFSNSLRSKENREQAPRYLPAGRQVYLILAPRLGSATCLLKSEAIDLQTAVPFGCESKAFALLSLYVANKRNSGNRKFKNIKKPPQF